MEHQKLKTVWVDLGGDGIPMSVIDRHPSEWKNMVTAEYVPKEYWARFKQFVEVPAEIGMWDVTPPPFIVSVTAVNENISSEAN